MLALKRIALLFLLLFVCSYGQTTNMWENDERDSVYIPLKWECNDIYKHRDQKRAPRQIPSVLYNGEEIKVVSLHLLQVQYSIASSDVIVKSGVLELMSKKHLYLFLNFKMVITSYS